MEMESEVGGMSPPAKEQRGPAAAPRSRETGLEQQHLAWRLQREPPTTNTFVSDFLPPEMGENPFLLFQAVRVVIICHRGPRKLVELESLP